MPPGVGGSPSTAAGSSRGLLHQGADGDAGGRVLVAPALLGGPSVGVAHESEGVSRLVGSECAVHETEGTLDVGGGKVDGEDVTDCAFDDLMQGAAEPVQ